MLKGLTTPLGEIMNVLLLLNILKKRFRKHHNPQDFPWSIYSSSEMKMNQTRFSTKFLLLYIILLN